MRSQEIFDTCGPENDAVSPKPYFLEYVWISPKPARPLTLIHKVARVRSTSFPFHRAGGALMNQGASGRSAAIPGRAEFCGREEPRMPKRPSVKQRPLRSSARRKPAVAYEGVGGRPRSRARTRPRPCSTRGRPAPRDAGGRRATAPAPRERRAAPRRRRLLVRLPLLRRPRGARGRLQLLDRVRGPQG